MDITEMVNGLTKMETTNKYFSKVNGNINWTIRIETGITGKKYAYAGRAGALRKRGLTSAYIREICERNIRWFDFTYKKDFEEMVELLKVDEYMITRV